MIALFASALLAALPAQPVAHKAAPQVRMRVLPAGTLLPTERGFWRERARCPDGVLHETSYDPALLLRPQDRAAAVPKKLGDLPPGRACLVEASPTEDLK